MTAKRPPRDHPDAYHDLPTPRATVRSRHVRVLVICNTCNHHEGADPQAIVGEGRGDVLLSKVRFRCPQCGSARTDFVMVARDW